MKFDTPIGTNRFQRQEVHRKYSEQLPKKFVETKGKEYTNGREKWNDAVKTIIGYGVKKYWVLKEKLITTMSEPMMVT